MKLLFDFFPVLLFFISFKFYGIFVATMVAIAASVLQVGTFWLKKRKIEKMHLVTLAMMVVLGGATLLLHDELYIKWKPTVINWAFALVFFGSHFIGKKPLIQKMMDKNVELPDVIWRRLNFSWIIFFILVGIANVYVLYNFDTNTWVNFKLFGVLGLTVLFVFAQAIYMTKHMPAPEEGNQEA